MMTILAMKPLKRVKDKLEDLGYRLHDVNRHSVDDQDFL